ncbi:MAG: hypothetical protein ACYTCU_01845 [Planctomycetota bacterium]
MPLAGKNNVMSKTGTGGVPSTAGDSQKSPNLPCRGTGSVSSNSGSRSKLPTPIQPPATSEYVTVGMAESSPISGVAGATLIQRIELVTVTSDK